MADFTADLQSFKPSFPFLDIDPNMELILQFSGISPSVLENSNFNLQPLLPFSNDNFLGSQTAEFPGNLAENFLGIVNQNNQNHAAPFPQLSSTSSAPAGNEFQESKKRKIMEISESSSANTSPHISETGVKRKNVIISSFLFDIEYFPSSSFFWSIRFGFDFFSFYELFVRQGLMGYFCLVFQSLGKGKRVKINNVKEEDQKSKEVVHVRARRGQATDSHSLAERVNILNYFYLFYFIPKDYQNIQ